MNSGVYGLAGISNANPFGLQTHKPKVHDQRTTIAFYTCNPAFCNMRQRKIHISIMASMALHRAVANHCMVEDGLCRMLFL